jgi:hypothetical protein
MARGSATEEAVDSINDRGRQDGDGAGCSHPRREPLPPSLVPETEDCNVDPVTSHMSDEQIAPVLAHRVFVTNHPKDFREMAAITCSRSLIPRSRTRAPPAWLSRYAGRGLKNLCGRGSNCMLARCTALPSLGNQLMPRRVPAALRDTDADQSRTPSCLFASGSVHGCDSVFTVGVHRSSVPYQRARKSGWATACLSGRTFGMSVERSIHIASRADARRYSK